MLQWILPAPLEGAAVAVVALALTYALHSTAFLGGAWILDRLGTVRRRPRARWLLWWFALLAPLVTSSVQQAVREGPGIEMAAAESEKVVGHLPGPPVGSGSEPASPPGPRPSTEEASVSRLAGSLAHEWPFLLLSLWAAAALSMAAFKGSRWRSLQRALQNRRILARGPARTALDGILEVSGTDRSVRLSMSSSLPGPVALPGREICLPRRALSGLTGEELRALLAHEVAHLERRDPTLRLLLSGLECALFFQPFVRTARRRIVAAAESLSDDWVRERGWGVALAGTLVTVAGWIRGRSEGAPVSGLADSPGIEARVRRLLGDAADQAGSASDRESRGWLVAAVALLSLGALVGPRVGVETPEHALVSDPGRGASLPVSSVRINTSDDLERAHRLLGPDHDVSRRMLGPLFRGHGPAAYVCLPDVDGPIRVTVRPSNGPLRVVVPGRGTFRPKAGPREGGLAALTVIRFTELEAREVELRVPPERARLAVEAGGRYLASRDLSHGSDLPRLVQPMD